MLQKDDTPSTGSFLLSATNPTKNKKSLLLLLPMSTKPIDDITEKMNEVDSGELAEKRKNYYSSWNSFAKEAITKTKEEEEEDAEAAKAKLGLDKDEPKSEAEKKDREKRAALREAKKQWEGKEVMSFFPPLLHSSAVSVVAARFL